MTHNKKHIGGLTFVELMMTLAIAAILSAVAAPSFNNIIQDNKLVTQVNSLQASLSFARSEAIKRNNFVTVCGSNDGENCIGGWNTGRSVLVDNNLDNTVGADEPILLVVADIASKNTLNFNRSRVAYTGTGIARGGSNGTFTFCDNRGEISAKGIIVSNTGRPRLAVDRDADGIVESGSNHNVSCP
jgi:type IV fimbrial biogenesis protein FimT